MGVMIREIAGSDAQKFLGLNKKLDRETSLMLLEPDERNTSVGEQQGIISRIVAKKNAIFVALVNDELIGFIAAVGGKYRRNKHCTRIIIGVLQQFMGQHVGTKLFDRITNWAKLHKIYRLELTVMVHNERAIGLYQKVGFEIEGTRKNSLFVNGRYVDEYYMGLVMTKS